MYLTHGTPPLAHEQWSLKYHTQGTPFTIGAWMTIFNVSHHTAYPRWLNRCHIIPKLLQWRMSNHTYMIIHHVTAKLYAYQLQEDINQTYYIILLLLYNRCIATRRTLKPNVSPPTLHFYTSCISCMLVEGDKTDTTYYMYIIRAVTATLYAFH